MTVLVIGASQRALRQLRTIAPSRVDIVDEPVAEPDWVIVSTGAQRIEAVAAHRLAPFRVLEIPEIATAIDPPRSQRLRRTLETMAGIGESRPLISWIGLAMVHPFIRRGVRGTALDAASTAHDTSVAVPRTSGVLKPIPAGTRLDDLLAARERKRIERFLSQVQRWPSDGSA